MLCKQRPRKAQEMLGKELMPYYSERVPPYVDKPRQGDGLDFEDVLKQWVIDQEQMQQSQSGPWKTGKLLPWTSNAAWAEEGEKAHEAGEMRDAAAGSSSGTYVSRDIPEKVKESDAWLSSPVEPMYAEPAVASVGGDWSQMPVPRTIADGTDVAVQ